MPETPVNPATPEPEPAEGSGRHPGEFDQAQLETVRKSEGVARTAKKSEYHQRLIDEGMGVGAPAADGKPATLPTPDALLAECANWRELSRKALEATGGKKEATGLGTDAETTLRREVEFYRGKARLAINQHRDWKEAEIDAFKARYFINKDIFVSRSLAEQSVGDILKHATADTLPGVTPARLEKSAAAITAYQSPEGEQSDAQSQATRLRNQRDKSFAEVIRLRQEIQLAADTAWPWHDD